jgi:2-methylaconitate cis-trans-isomerase PrpF
VCLGTAAKIEGTIDNEIYREVQPDNPPAVRIGHPTGTIQVEIEIEKIDGNLELTKAALARTARCSWTVMSMSVTKTLWR